MFKKKYLGLAISATLAAGAAQAFDAESFTVSGYVKNETAALTKDGAFNGQETGPTDTTNYNDRGDLIKSESSVKFFVNGDVGEGSSMHAELLLHNDSKAKGSHFKSSDSYTQSEFLRELYLDTKAGDWDVRVGKQQIVWGKADGAKFLDMINPTDYREMAQNVMAESRVPTWGALFDKYTADGGNIQFAITQPRENVFAGLNRDIDTSAKQNNNNIDTTSNNGHDSGNPFILKGVDSITGERYGFTNIVPDLGSVAYSFWATFGNDFGSFAALRGSTGVTVGGFAMMPAVNINTAAGAPFGATIAGYADLGMDGAAILNAFASSYNTVLNVGDSAATWGATDDSVFEYMDLATFATFDAFVGAKSQYVFNMPKNSDVDLSTRYSNSTANGINYSAIYSYAYDKNPIINISWRNDSGEKLTTSYGVNNSLTLTDSDGTRYGALAGGSPTLRFEQTVERAHNIGGGLDFAVDTDSLGPVVIRAEGLYTKDSYQPVIDKGYLAIGDLPNALTMVKTDRFKYVIGADVTVATDMMVSAQFIQDRNLDFVDTTSNLSGNTRDRYTASYAAMHMTNGFQKDIENKEFYSIFLSKPFGDSGEGRWNNILMLEEGGGRWNRFDVEYSLTNDLIGTVEYNKYWGDDNSQFGQLEAASNVQVGLKYLFE